MIHLQKDEFTVNKSVNINEFPTYVLVGELFNRIYDNMNDEEPQSDRLLEVLTKEQKEDILTYLTEVVNDI